MYFITLEFSNIHTQTIQYRVPHPFDHEINGSCISQTLTLIRLLNNRILRSHVVLSKDHFELLTPFLAQIVCL